MPIRPQIADHIDRLVTQAQATGRAPSLILGVVRGGELIHVAAAGDDPTPNPDTQYRIGSITKTMTATLVMRLRDEGRLSLDDPLERHLPGTPLGAVTIRHLLAHVSGLQREPYGSWWERAPGVAVSDLLASLDSDMLVLPSQRTFHYSNLAYGVLGAVVAQLSGEPWFEVLGKQLLQPLGMSRTTYQCAEPFARGYVVHPFHGTLREEPRHDAGAMAPAGQLWSTVTDLARWAAFLADPQPDVISPATVDEMASVVALSDQVSWTAGYGLGLHLVRRGERVYVGHSGSMPGYLAMLLVYRPSKVGAVAFCNAYNATVGMQQLCGAAIDAVLDADPTPPVAWRPATAIPAPLAELTGRWWFMGIEYAATAEPGDSGGLELVMRPVAQPNAVPWRFTQEGPDRWRGHSGGNNGELLTVRRDADGGIVCLDIATFEFTRDPWPELGA